MTPAEIEEVRQIVREELAARDNEALKQNLIAAGMHDAAERKGLITKAEADEHRRAHQAAS